MSLTVGSLFSGIGGFDLGLERAGMRVIWQSEIDPYASAVLKKHWPHVPNHGDIRTITAARVERPDLLCGGFPCQDVSLAGARLGLEGERSGLWSEYARVIGELEPRFVVVENTPGLLSLGMDAVLAQLAALGFDAEWHCIPASALGAPHVRDRVWILAYPSSSGLSAGRQVQERAESIQSVLASGGNHQPVAGPWEASGTWEEPRLVESPLGSTVDGVSRRLVRIANRGALETLGNAIVPQIAEIIGRAILTAQPDHTDQEGGR